VVDLEKFLLSPRHSEDLEKFREGDVSDIFFCNLFVRSFHFVFFSRGGRKKNFAYINSFFVNSLFYLPPFPSKNKYRKKEREREKHIFFSTDLFYYYHLQRKK
jgi:hypothetical protein